mmetsp:Transcript_121724/g.349887  ORF Transcript_121724/g.349887 Transcript_121724/m.349887 type:complete len:280 (-) Transcript_121724:71-910(-)
MKKTSSAFLSDEEALDDLPLLGQLCHELEVGNQLIVGLLVPLQQPHGVVYGLVLQLVQVAIHGGGHAAGIFGDFDFASSLLEQLRVLLQDRDGGERHQPEEPLGFLVGEALALDPVREANGASGLHDPRSLVDDELLVGQVTPSILAVDEVRARVRETVLQRVLAHEGNPVTQAFLLRALDALGDDGLREVYPDHRIHAAQAHQAPHPAAVVAVQVHALHPRAEASLLGQLHGARSGTDVDLLTHDELPDALFRAAVALRDGGERRGARVAEEFHSTHG